MLTTHDYHRIADDWDKEKILECCKPGGSDQPCGDCCYDTWETELNKVTPAYNASVEATTQLQSRYDFVTSRRDRYKIWIDELDKAELLARDVCNQLQIIAVQSDKIWFNSCQAEKAVEILFCMLRDIYMQIDEIKTLYDSVQNCVARNNDPALGKGTGILKYLDDYKTKLDATIKTRDDVIKNLCLAIQLAALLRNGISTKDCADQGYTPCDKNAPPPCATVSGVAYYGFKTVICEWYNSFACDTACGTVTATPVPAAGAATADCNPDCELIPTFDFPICNNSFKNDVQQWLDNDNALLLVLAGQLKDAKMRQQALLGCKTSLDQAIKAVDPAARCK